MVVPLARAMFARAMRAPSLEGRRLGPGCLRNNLSYLFFAFPPPVHILHHIIVIAIIAALFADAAFLVLLTISAGSIIHGPLPGFTNAVVRFRPICDGFLIIVRVRVASTTRCRPFLVIFLFCLVPRGRPLLRALVLPPLLRVLLCCVNNVVVVKEVVFP